MKFTPNQLRIAWRFKKDARVLRHAVIAQAAAIILSELQMERYRLILAQCCDAHDVAERMYKDAIKRKRSDLDINKLVSQGRELLLEYYHGDQACADLNRTKEKLSKADLLKEATNYEANHDDLEVAEVYHDDDETKPIDVSNFFFDSDELKKKSPPAIKRPQMIHVVNPKYVPPETGGHRAKDRRRLFEALASPKRVQRVTPDRADEIAAALHEEAPWMQEVTTYVLHRLRELGDRPAVLPPILLVGPPGCGKTFFADILCRGIGSPHSRIELGASHGTFDIAGTEFAWSESAPGEPVSLLMRSEHATVSIIVDELDKAARKSNGGDPHAALLTMLSPSTSKAFRCPYFAVPVNLSMISWIMTANTLENIAAPLLDRVKVFHVGLPRGEELYKLVEGRLQHVSVNHEAVRFICEHISAGRMSIRGVDRIAETIADAQRRRNLH